MEGVRITDRWLIAEDASRILNMSVDKFSSTFFRDKKKGRKDRVLKIKGRLYVNIESFTVSKTLDTTKKLYESLLYNFVSVEALDKEIIRVYLSQKKPRDFTFRSRLETLFSPELKYSSEMDREILRCLYIIKNRLRVKSVN